MTGFSSSRLVEALHAAGPAPDRADRMGLYAFLVGDWTMEAIYHPEAGRTLEGTGEIHAGWALEGRAIQDVWITPPRRTREAGTAPPLDFYGTTLRVYDPGIDGWHILWIDPVKQTYRRQIGRARGRDIVQEGTDEAGNRVRWSFTEITPASFRWLGETSPDDGAAWRLVVEFRARRVGAPPAER